MLTSHSTTGGQGGNQTIIVSNYTELVAGVKDDIPRIVILNGTITQAGKVRVGSNKSIIGAGANASEFYKRRIIAPAY